MNWRTYLGLALMALGTLGFTALWFWMGVVAWQVRNDPARDPATFTIWVLFTAAGSVGLGLMIVNHDGEAKE